MVCHCSLVISSDMAVLRTLILLCCVSYHILPGKEKKGKSKKQGDSVSKDVIAHLSSDARTFEQLLSLGRDSLVLSCQAFGLSGVGSSTAMASRLFELFHPSLQVFLLLTQAQLHGQTSYHICLVHLGTFMEANNNFRQWKVIIRWRRHQRRLGRLVTTRLLAETVN